MGGLRQRRKGGSGDPGDGGLSEPLLGGSGSEPGSSPRVVGGAESVERDGDGDERGAGGGGFDLLGAIVDFFVSVFASMGLCSRPPPPLSDVQRLRLSKLAARAAVPYNPRSDAHVDALRELWRLTFPGRALPGLQCDEWKEMGWQGTDPATDFRSGGFMSLENLVWFARNQPRVYQRLMTKQDGARSEWEYPFAAAGVNITFQLVNMLELSDPSVKMGVSPGPGQSATDGAVVTGDEGACVRRPRVSAPTSPAGVSFVDALSDEDDAFERLYVTWFEVLDREWLERRATYMEFPQVMGAAKKRVVGALERAGRRRGGCTMAGVREELEL